MTALAPRQWSTRLGWAIALGVGCFATACGGEFGTSGPSAGTGGAAGSGATAGTTGSAGKGGGAGGASAGTGGSAGSAASSGAGGACAGTCTIGVPCCNGACRNFENDPNNCGKCGNVCPSGSPLCQGGQCVVPACTAELCAPGSPCCGSTCCLAGQICCDVSSGGPAPVGGPAPSCVVPVNGTCPVGCPACVCAAPDTPIATPAGDLPIAALRPGDLIYSVSARGVVVVPVLRINRAPVKNHTMVQIQLANGNTLELSPRHPTADGRLIGELRSGERLDNVEIRSVERIPYSQPYTYDILADSESGAYFAGGVLIGSTLASPAPVPQPAVAAAATAQ